MPGRSTVGLSALALAATCVAALAGCTAASHGGSAETSSVTTGTAPDSAASTLSNAPTPEADRAGRRLSKAETSGVLPTVATMPTGWSGDPDNSLRDHSADTRSVVRPARCAPLYNGIDEAYGNGAVKSYVTFMSGSQGPFVGVGISSSDDVALKAFGASLAALPSCRNFRVIDGKDVQDVTASPLSVPKLGDENLAIRFEIVSESFLARFDALRVRVGHNILCADELAAIDARPRTKELVDATRATISNLRG